MLRKGGRGGPSAIRDREILDSISINDYAEEEKKTDEESNDVPPEKPKLSKIAHAIELLECWYLFDNGGDEIRQSLRLISKRFDKHSLETKKQSKIHDFFKKLSRFCYFTRKRLTQHLIPNVYFFFIP